MGKKKNNRNELHQTTDRHILGTYFEMAYENYIRTMRIICNRQLKIPTNEYGIPDVNSLAADQPLRLRRLLFRHFPFLAPIMDDVIKQANRSSKKEKKASNLSKKQKTAILDNSISDILGKLEIFARELEYCRNRFTHKNAYNLNVENNRHFEREKEIAKMMEVLMKAERELLKNRKDREKNGKAMRIFLSNDNKHYYKDRRGITVRSNQFYFNPDIFELNSKGLVDLNTIELSKFGRIFFCSLFLRSQNAERFAYEMCVFINSPWPDIRDKKSNPPTYSPSPENKIMRDVMQMHRIRIPREKRIDAVQTKGTLLMDILEELRRCPKILYDTFNPTTKSTFNHIVEQPDGNKSDTLMVRYQDRFSQLALRYIDQNKLFTFIRFQLRLGLFRFRFYDKTLIDGTPTIRTVHKELNGYGRWQEVEEKRVAIWGDNFQKVELKKGEDEEEIEQLMPDTKDTDPYVTDWRTTYNIHTERIGMSWGDVNVKGKIKKGSPLLSKTENCSNGDGYYYIPDLPDLKASDGHNCDRKVSISQDVPLCTLSTYDLPALLFYQYLLDIYGRKGANNFKAPLAESIIIEKYYDIKELFETAKEDTCTPESLKLKQQELGLDDHDIPNKLLSFIRKEKFNPKEDRVEHVKNVLKGIIKDINGRLDSFNNKEKRIHIGGRSNRYGNPHHADVRHGSLARYLMRSLLRWQPIDPCVKHQGKLTSINARALMASLANYGVDEKGLPLTTVLTNAGMLGGKNPHPFINKALNSSNNIEKLYVAYLKEEKNHINSILNDICSKLTSLPPFLRTSDMKNHWGIDKDQRTYINQYASELSKVPIQLPDGLFTKHIVQLLVNAIPQNKKLEVMCPVLNADNRKIDNEGHLKGNVPSNSASHIIGYYFEKVLGDNSQEFYNSQISKYMRFYENISKLAPHRKPNKELIPDYFTQEEIQKKIKSARQTVKGMKDEDSITLRDKLNKVEEKEKRIRRHRIEDIVLFLSAKQMLLDTVGISLKEEGENINNIVESKENRKQMKIKAEELKLQKFSFDEDFQFLSEGDNEQQRQEKMKSDDLLDYTYPYKIKIDGKTKGTINIKQKGLSLKNYGNIYSVLGDDRLKSLMAGLFEMEVEEVTLGTIAAEFANFDQIRSSILKLLQDNIEQIAFERNIAILNNNNNRDRSFYSVKDKDGNQIKIQITDPKTNEVIAPSKDAIRNQFPELIALLKEYEDSKDDINELRKAVAHNHYPKGIATLPPTQKKRRELPNIAHLAKTNLEKEIKEAQKKTKSDDNNKL